MHPELNDENVIRAVATAAAAGEHVDRLETGSLADELRAQQIVNRHALRLDVVQAFDLKAGQWRLVDSGRVQEA